MAKSDMNYTFLWGSDSAFHPIFNSPFHNCAFNIYKVFSSHDQTINIAMQYAFQFSQQPKHHAYLIRNLWWQQWNWWKLQKLSWSINFASKKIVLQTEFTRGLAKTNACCCLKMEKIVQDNGVHIAISSNLAMRFSTVACNRNITNIVLTIKYNSCKKIISVRVS